MEQSGTTLEVVSVAVALLSSTGYGGIAAVHVIATLSITVDH
jgi:hypothetical protein